MTTTRHIVLATRPAGAQAGPENFRLEEVPLPAPAEGQVALRMMWLSVDPYMRGRMDDARSYIAPFQLDAPIDGGGVAEVTASAHPDYAPGDVVTGMMPWAEHAVVAVEGLRKLDPAHGPYQRTLSVMGMPGLTAWVGLTRIAQAKSGETVLISAATGAVGSVAGQLAKARGLRVIGTAGGAEKCAYAVEELGYDACLDHRQGDMRALSQAMKEAAPDGIDVYFENVGGKTLGAVVPRMSDFGRIALCGMIAWYDGRNMDEAVPLPAVWVQILKRRLNVQGFIVTDHSDTAPDFFAEVAPLLASGQITMPETVADGLEAGPAALLGLMEGQNFGKQLVRVGEDPA